MRTGNGLVSNCLGCTSVWQANEANLVGYYRFDDPGEAVSADGSPSMNPARFSDVPPIFVLSDAPICP
jgi:hypothetical protein